MRWVAGGWSIKARLQCCEVSTGLPIRVVWVTTAFFVGGWILLYSTVPCMVWLSTRTSRLFKDLVPSLVGHLLGGCRGTRHLFLFWLWGTLFIRWDHWVRLDIRLDPPVIGRKIAFQLMPIICTFTSWVYHIVENFRERKLLRIGESTTTKPWNSQKFSPSKVSYYVLASSLWLIATHIGPTFISKPWEIPPRGHFHSAITFSLVPMAGHQERKSITYLDMPRRTKWCSENWTVCVMIKMQINNLLIYFPIYQFWRWHYCIWMSCLLPSFPSSLHFRRENLGMRLHTCI